MLCSAFDNSTTEVLSDQWKNYKALCFLSFVQDGLPHAFLVQTHFSSVRQKVTFFRCEWHFDSISYSLMDKEGQSSRWEETLGMSRQFCSSLLFPSENVMLISSNIIIINVLGLENWLLKFHLHQHHEVYFFFYLMVKEVEKKPCPIFIPMFILKPSQDTGPCVPHQLISIKGTKVI